MEDKPSNSKPDSNDVFYARWEKKFNRILNPLEEFIHRQTTAGVLLMVMAAFALVLANSGFGDAYQQFRLLPVSIGFGAWELNKELYHWVNDGLMAIFFFVVGLELKREFLVGELANKQKAILPVAAAVGGMAVPAIIYYLFNMQAPTSAGWGIPMATDIAFALGILALMSKYVPKALVAFLVAVAIVDDIGAVTVIAVFYTDTISISALAAVAFLFLILLALNYSGIRKVTPYLLVSILMWYFLLLSGVHATLAGVLGAFALPSIPKYNPNKFEERVKGLIAEFHTSYQHNKNIVTNASLTTIVHSIESDTQKVQTMSQRMEHMWHLPVAFIVIPIFVLINAGIPIDFATLSDTLTHPTALGISLGLILGKLLGITGFSWLFLKLGYASLPSGVRFTQIAGVALLAGIGFTMSIFIAELAFAPHPDLLLTSKTAIMSASLLAGIFGAIWLYLVRDKASE